MPLPKVISLTSDLMQWSFEGEWPTINVPAPKGFYSQSHRVDPFPAYMHDIKLVRSELNRVSTLWPLGHPLNLAILDREAIGRMNGQCEIHQNYSDDKEKRPWAATICFWGKRVPPHPAMTRYLVAHEYGHAVDKAISWNRGDTDNGTLRTEYAKLRDLKSVPHYGGGTWHRSAGEVLACDFRILVANSESEFWPHPGIARPQDCREAIKFWEAHKK